MKTTPGRIWKAMSDPRSVALIIVVITLAVSFQSYFLKKDIDPATGIQYTYYNNYLIFKNSFLHLEENTSLYSFYPDEYYDLYKYSPTFALFMAPFAGIPALPGLILWNLLNALVLIAALWRIPFRSSGYRLLALAFILIELVTSLQNQQSNALMAGMIIFAFLAMEKKKVAVASLLIIATFYIKIYGVVALMLFMLYPGRLKATAYSVFWLILLGLAPLVMVSWGDLSGQYQDWLTLLGADSTNFSGLSVSGWLRSWFGLHVSNYFVLASGSFLLLMPLLRFKHYHDGWFRLLYLCSVLVWMVIFNHMAESPTFIIAVSGVSIWYFTRPFRKERLVILLFVLLFTVLSPTDLVPGWIRQDYFRPYVLKAFPCILVWAWIWVEQMFPPLHRKIS